MNEPINRCPYCMAPMERKPTDYRLTPRQWSVYKMVLDAGLEGVSIKDLMEDHFQGKSEGTLRTCVYAINQIINPLRLEGRGGKYYLGRSKWSGEKCDLPPEQEPTSD